MVAPGAAALLSAATAFALHHSPAPAPKPSPVKAADPGARADDAAGLRSQSKSADAELTRLRAQLAQLNSELAKAGSAPPREAAAAPPAEVVPVALEPAAQPAPAPAPAPAPPVDASTGAS